MKTDSSASGDYPKSADVVEEWNLYVESMGSVMGEAEQIAQRMAHKITRLRIALRESEDIACRRTSELGALDKRIGEFADAVESVKFKCDEQQAEPWMGHWRLYLFNAG